MRGCDVGLVVFGVFHPFSMCDCVFLPLSLSLTHSLTHTNTKTDRQTQAGLIKVALHPD